MKPLRYVLYAVWRWKIKDRREQFPVLVATISLTVSLSFNVFSAVADHLTGTRWLEEVDRNQLVSMALVMWIAIFLIVHASWVSNGKFAAVVSEFQDEPNGVRLRHTIYVSAYFVATIGMLAVMAVLG